MQEYLQRSRLGEGMDALGGRLLLLAGCLGWFGFLWGLRLPALTAGAALYLLLLLLRRKSREGRLLRREKRLREQLGGELALERLLLSEPAKAHFEMAMLLSLRHPLTLLRTLDEGVLCSLRGELLLLALAQQAPACPLSAQDVLAFQRSAKGAGAARGVLCTPCPISPEAREQAQGALPVSFLSRELLISLFGQAAPASDAQLVALGKRKRARAPARRWIAHVLDRRRARRYALYAALLLFLYAFTHLPYYAPPGLLCALLAAACRCRPEEKETL